MLKLTGRGSVAESVVTDYPQGCVIRHDTLALLQPVALTARCSRRDRDQWGRVGLQVGHSAEPPPSYVGHPMLVDVAIAAAERGDLKPGAFQGGDDLLRGYGRQRPATSVVDQAIAARR